MSDIPIEAEPVEEMPVENTVVLTNDEMALLESYREWRQAGAEFEVKRTAHGIVVRELREAEVKMIEARAVFDQMWRK